MKLSLLRPAYYRVKGGQTLQDVANAFLLPPSLIASHNRLSAELYAGQVLALPAREGNLYTVQGGESKRLLCGSEENFERKNGTKALYVGQTVLL